MSNSAHAWDTCVTLGKAEAPGVCVSSWNQSAIRDERDRHPPPKRKQAPPDLNAAERHSFLEVWDQVRF